MDRREFIRATLVLLPSTAKGADQIGETLDGTWLVVVEGEKRERLLRIVDASAESGKIRVGDIRYGWIDAKTLSQVTDFDARFTGDRLQISFVTNAGSRIVVSLRSGEESLEGTFDGANGKHAAIRMTRLSTEEVSAIASNVAPSVGGVGRYPSSGPLHVVAGSRISLVYLGANNCVACRGYKAEYFGSMDIMRKSLPEFHQIEYVEISLGGFNSNVRSKDLPEHLAWAAGDRPNGKPILRARGTPAFFAAVDKEIWAQGHGVAGLESIVIPQIRLAVAERSRLAH
ncbi:hypothetical protein AB4Z48_11365 [Cupriavidus sp. 2TAF22]|uniref:hypothetical protein n=1 Tax=unclassified Cupriavidus TaxID=2640874 RepID=UPI003F8F3A1D